MMDTSSTSAWKGPRVTSHFIPEPRGPHGHLDDRRNRKGDRADCDGDAAGPNEPVA